MTPIAQYTSRSRHASTSGSSAGPGTSTDSSHSRSQSSSRPEKADAALAQAFDGYSGTNVSGSTTSRAPSSAARPTSSAAFSTLARASRITGVAWTAATRTVSNTAMGRA